MFVCDGLYAVVYLKPKQLIIKDCARRFLLKLYIHEASRGLFATAELLVFKTNDIFIKFGGLLPDSAHRTTAVAFPTKSV